MLRKLASGCAALLTLCATTGASAQDQPQPAAQPPQIQTAPQQAQTVQAAPPEEKQTWTAPFGGTFTAGLTLATDYSYRGISQTQRQPAVQPSFGYETPSFGEAVAISAYVGAWGSNVNFPGTGANPEIDLLAGFKAKAFEGKLTGDLGYIRYNYLGAPANLQYDFNEFGLVLGYDFGVVALSGAVRYSPNFFANSGIAWYKWAQAVVPLPFININENVSFKVFGTIGNQYVERFTNYGIPWNNYWDWQIGLTMTLYGFDLTLAYTDTNIDYQGCLSTYNCQARAIFMVSKTF
jgi:uncharacterized protein (TIGR02001 family)